MRPFALLVSAACLLAAGLPAGAAGPVDALARQDRVRLMVLEWLPAKGEYKEWEAVGGDYTIAPDDSLTVPFVGRVPTAGRSLSELSVDIGAALQRRLSLPTRPEVRLEVAARAPVYVLGGVENPGKVEFTPGLRAMEAVALAGGFYRGGATLRIERDTINAESDLREAREAASRLEAKIMRLEAELADAPSFEVDAAEAAAKGVAPFLPEEKQLFDVRRQARQSRSESLKNRRQLAVDQLKTLDDKLANLDQQIENTRKQLGDVESLVRRGLTVTTRAFDLERTLTDLEGRRLDLDIGRLATNLELNEADRDSVDLVTEFRTSVAGELQDGRAALAQRTVEIDRALGLVREAAGVTRDVVADRAGNVTLGARLFVTRVVEGRSSTTEIDRDAVLQSGDTLQIQLELDDEALAGRDQAAGERRVTANR